MTTSRASESASAGTWAGRRLSYDDFLREAPDDGRSREWVDGRVIELHVGLPASEVRRRLHLERLRAHDAAAPRLDPAAKQRKQEPLQVLMPIRRRALASEHLDRLRENHLAGPADLAVEIVSPDTRTRDTVEKLREYEEGGVREYWLVDHKLRRFESDWLWQRPLPPLLSILKEWKLV